MGTSNKVRGFSFFWIKLPLVIVLLLSTCQYVCGQAWMQGYNFRKIINIDKSKVQGSLNLLNFNVLIELEFPELKNLSGCRRSIFDHGRLPVSFALKNAPTVPIGFQIDSYDPDVGRLYCWVQIAELIAGNNPGLNELYFYYGGNTLHNPASEESRGIWSSGYQQVWHMDLGAYPATSFSALHSVGNDVVGNPAMNAANFVPGFIGTGTAFNGTSDAMSAPIDTNRKLNVSAWIKLAQYGKEQVILTNDSAGNGYRIRVNAQGKLVFDIILSGSVNSHIAFETLPEQTWTYICVIFDGMLKRIYINGLYKGGGVAPVLKKDAGGTIKIGSSRQNEHYFKGFIDELRIANIARTLEWVSTEYRNQFDPSGFICVSAEEVNPLQTIDVNEFTGGTGTDDWRNEHNWSLGQLPDMYSNIIIKANKEVQLSIGEPASINRLTLESGAKLVLVSNLEVNCNVQIDSTAVIVLNEQVNLTFKNDVVNNGIISGQQNGLLLFSGAKPLQSFSGTGTANVSALELKQALPDQVLQLNAQIDVSRQVKLTRGILNSNEQLTLLAKGPGTYAVLMPFDNHDTHITGKVKVQQYIDGNFSSPSTARGWWLLSSPVYHTTEHFLQHDFSAIQRSIFVTGPGGAINGFDPSPNNGSTIYTHHQELPGTLSQKYKGIANMNSSVMTGKGFYVFSRGSRLAPNAFEHQIQHAPFSNPQPYLLTHKGELFTDELQMNLFNRNMGEPGDGFNLLGNPYAWPVSWGGLKKLNVLPFIWVFDPKNNAYRVTDDADYVIHTGTGFFVRVSTGNASGEVTFMRESKNTGMTTLTGNRIASADQQARLKQKKAKTKLKVELKKDDLTDDYILMMQPEGNDEITDADALKIGEGYLSVSSLTTEGIKLAIDERKAGLSQKKIQLFIKGWITGTYTLKLSGSLNNDEQITLIDHYLDKSMVVKNGELLYSFYLDIANKDTYGEKRFALLVQPLPEIHNAYKGDEKEILRYPNPVNDIIHIKSSSKRYDNLKVLVRNIDGSLMWSRELLQLEPGIPLQLPFHQFMKGVYILQLIDLKKSRTVTTFKILKN